MNKFILLTVLFIVGCIAAPSPQDNNTPRNPSVLSRPTPINPDIQSDPKPQDKITLINNDEQHKLKQKRDNEPKRPIPQTLPGPVQIPTLSHNLHKREDFNSKQSSTPTAVTVIGSTQPTAKPESNSDSNRRPYQPVSSSSSSQTQHGRIQKREDNKPKPQTLPLIPDNSKLDQNKDKKSTDTSHHKDNKRDIPVPVREESTSTTKKPEITETQPHPATVVRPVPVSQIFGKRQQEEDKSQQTPSTDDIKSPAHLP